MSGKLTPQQVQEVLSQADLLHDETQVESALDTMANQIGARLKESNPLIIGVMIGGLVPMGALLARMNFPLEMDYLHATRYKGGTRGGDLHWLARPTHALQDRVVLVVDDILDEGITLTDILDYCRGEGAREVYSAALVEKIHGRKPGIKTADFTGLSVEDRYVFGYGMDYRGYLRNVRGVYAVRGL